MKNKIGLLFILVTHLFYAQKPKRYVTLDRFFNEAEAKHKLMGDVAIFKDSTVVYHYPIGFKNPANRKEINKTTKFRIGSISKLFTATLILKAKEENLLRLENTLDSYYPNIANAANITLKNLLNHTSGLVDFTQKQKDKTLLYKEQTKDSLLAMITKEKVNPPNGKFEYANTNYLLLSFILEDIYHKTYANLLTEKITAPLHLKNTYYGGKMKYENNEAHSFRYINGWLKQPETSPSVARGAGAIVSNCQDLSTFINALFNGELLSKESLDLMKPTDGDYGLGMFKVPFGNNIFGFGHNGQIDGFKSNLFIIPHQNTVFVTLFNSLNTDDNKVLLNMYRAVNNIAVVPFEKKNTLAHINNIQEYVGMYKNETFPLDIAITTNGKDLYAQATGQSKFKLDAYPKNVFQFDEAGIKMKFLPKQGLMLFIQGNTRFEFKREGQKQTQEPVVLESKKQRKKRRKKRRR